MQHIKKAKRIQESMLRLAFLLFADLYKTVTYFDCEETEYVRFITVILYPNTGEMQSNLYSYMSLTVDFGCMLA